MKKVEVLIASEQLSELQQMLEDLAIKEVAFSQIMKYQAEEKVQKKYRGACYQSKMLQQIKAELWVLEEELESIKQWLSESNLKNCRYYIYEITEQFH